MLATTTTSQISPIDVVSVVHDVAATNLGYLTLCITILLAAGGFFYLFNFKPLKESIDRHGKELGNLEEEVSQNLESSKQEIRSDLEEFKKTQQDDLTRTVKQQNEIVLAEVEARIANFSSEFSSKFDLFTDEKVSNTKTVLLAEIGNQVRVLEKSLSEKINVIKTDITTQITTLKDLKRDVLVLETEYYLQKNKIGALFSLIEKLELAIEEKHDWRIEGALIEIKDYIEKHSMPNVYSDKLRKAIEKVSDKYKLLKDDISKLAYEKLYAVK